MLKRKNARDVIKALRPLVFFKEDGKQAGNNSERILTCEGWNLEEWRKFLAEYMQGCLEQEKDLTIAIEATTAAKYVS